MPKTNYTLARMRFRAGERPTAPDAGTYGLTPEKAHAVDRDVDRLAPKVTGQPQARGAVLMADDCLRQLGRA